ncbi:MAG: hypothetical protein OXN95_08175 [bacterium]|nr:hypothetical protein [bacterium]
MADRDFGVVTRDTVGLVSGQYHVPMAMTLRLTEEEQGALRERAALDGMSMQEVVQGAMRDYIAKSDHRDRVTAAADSITQRHAAALQRHGE